MPNYGYAVPSFRTKAPKWMGMSTLQMTLWAQAGLVVPLNIYPKKEKSQ